jgi:hypothetical protein
MKIAYDNGIVERDEDKKNVGGGDKGRYSSETLEELEKKYNVDVTEDKTGRDLVDMAHPEKAEILNSYLKDADVVENANEQQDIMVDVALKGPTINDIHHREVTAITELMDELVVIADEMDVRDQADLSSFADGILHGMVATGEKVNKDVKKKLRVEATAASGVARAAPSLWKWLGIPVAGLLGAAFVMSKWTSSKAQKIPSAAETTYQTLDTFVASPPEGIDPNDVRIFSNIKTAIQTELTGIDKSLSNYQVAYNNALSTASGGDKNQLDEAVKRYNEARAILVGLDGNSGKLGKVLKVLEDQEGLAKGSVDTSTKTDSELGDWTNLKENTDTLMRLVHAKEGPEAGCVRAIAHLIQSIKNQKIEINKHKTQIDAEVKYFGQKAQTPPATNPPGTIDA